MSRILYSLGDGLWIGSKSGIARRMTALYDIDAFLGLGKNPVFYPRIHNISLVNPPPLDEIYQHIDDKRPGSLLIFSDDGISGAPEIAAGQLMRERDMTMETALRYIRNSCSDIRPDPVLLQQVEKWSLHNNFLTRT